VGSRDAGLQAGTREYQVNAQGSSSSSKALPQQRDARFSPYMEGRMLKGRRWLLLLLLLIFEY